MRKAVSAFAKTKMVGYRGSGVLGTEPVATGTSCVEGTQITRERRTQYYKKKLGKNAK